MRKQWIPGLLTLKTQGSLSGTVICFIERYFQIYWEEEDCVHTWGGDSLGEIEQRLRDEYNKLELRAGLIKAGLEATQKARKKGV